MAYAEIQRLTDLLSQANPSAAWNNFGTQQALAGVYGQSSAVTVPSAFFSRSERPRPCYCFVHGFNIFHDSHNCRVMASDEQYTPAMRWATTPVGTGDNPNVGPLVRLPYRFPPLPTSVCLDCLPSPPSPTQESSKPEHPNDESVGAGLATRAATTFRGANHSSRMRVNGQPVVSSPPDLSPNPHTVLVIPPPALSLVSRASRFSHPNPFSSLMSDSESDDENIANAESDDEEIIVSPSTYNRHTSNRLVTFPQPFTLLCPTVSRQPVSLPALVSALSSVSSPHLSSSLIANSGCTSILIQIANF